MLRTQPLPTLAIIVALSGCGRTEAEPPTAEGCWQGIATDAGQVTFRLLAEQPPNLESCAADLEIQFLRDRRPVSGAYEGYVISVDRAGIWAEQAPARTRYYVFSASNSAMLDRGLTAALRTVTTGSASKPGRSEPRHRVPTG